MKERSTLFALAALIAVFALALATHAGPTAPAPAESTAAPVVSPAAGPVTPAACPAPAGAELLGILPQAQTPHCCSQGEIDACRDGCRAQGPGCKGQIGCRAGECDCTCSCP